MTKTALLIVSLVLFVGLYSMNAQKLGQCLDEEMAGLENGKAPCDIANDLAKCLLKEMDLYKSGEPDEKLRYFKTTFEADLAKQCDVNIMHLVAELREEDRRGGTSTTAPTKGFAGAKTFGNCVDTLAAESKNGVSCSLLTPYLKCVFRVSNVDILNTEFSDEDHRAVQEIINLEMLHRGIQCDLNFRALVDDVRLGESGENQLDASTHSFIPSQESEENQLIASTRPFVPSQESGENQLDASTRSFVPDQESGKKPPDFSTRSFVPGQESEEKHPDFSTRSFVPGQQSGEKHPDFSTRSFVLGQEKGENGSDVSTRAFVSGQENEENQLDVSIRSFVPGQESGENGSDVSIRSFVPGQESGGNGSDVISRPFPLVMLLTFTVMPMLALHLLLCNGTYVEKFDFAGEVMMVSKKE